MEAENSLTIGGISSQHFQLRLPVLENSQISYSKSEVILTMFGKKKKQLRMDSSVNVLLGWTLPSSLHRMSVLTVAGQQK